MEKSNLLTGFSMPLTFQLIPGNVRPKIAFAQTASGRQWSILDNHGRHSKYRSKISFYKEYQLLPEDHITSSIYQYKQQISHGWIWWALQA
jgi:hypothetical protein